MKKILTVKNELDISDDFEFDFDDTEMSSDGVDFYLKHVCTHLGRRKSYKVLEMTGDFFNKADKAGFIYYHDHDGPMFGNIIVEVCDEIV